MRIPILNWAFRKEKTLPTLDEHRTRIINAEFEIARMRREILSGKADLESAVFYDQKFMELIRLYSEKIRR